MYIYLSIYLSIYLFVTAGPKKNTGKVFISGTSIHFGAMFT